MNTEVKSFEHNGFHIEIHYDENPINPRTDNHNDDLFVCFHKRYNLGDKHDYEWNNYNGWHELLEHLMDYYKPIIIKPLYMYDHSGITISTSPFGDTWDSGQIGFVLMSSEAAKRVYSAKKITQKIRKQAEKYIEASVKEYDSYLRGECYGYIIREVEDDDEGEEVESCWGFNDLDYCEEEAKSMADHLTHKEKVNPDQMELQLS